MMSRSRSSPVRRLVLACLLGIATAPFGGVATFAIAQTHAAGPGEPPVARAENLPPQTLGSPRELLALYGIDSGQWDALQSGRPLKGPEQAILLRILFRMPNIPRDKLQQWARNLELAELEAAAAQSRGQAVRLAGRARSVTLRTVPDEASRGLGFKRYAEVLIEAPGEQQLQVYTRNIPARWSTSGRLDEPVKAWGIFLKQGPGALLFAAPRIAWYPDRARPELAVSEDHVYLAGLGMDIGLFDDLEGRNRKPVGAPDRECFYQLLDAMQRTRPAELRQRAARFELAPLLQEPARHHGQLVTVTGTARRVTRILVDEPDVRRRFGIDHYFQIDLFVPLAEQTVQLGEGPDSPTFVNNYPVTICALELPAGVPEGENLSVGVRVPAVHFKLWAYRSQYVSSFDARQLQLSPMLVAPAPIVHQVRRSSNPYLGVLAGVLFLAVLAAIWYGVWWFQREDAAFTRTTLRRQQSLGQGQSLDELGLEPRREPDFRGLNEQSGDR